MPDGFISHFYSVSEHVSPVLAFGFLGPKPQLSEVCAFFKVHDNQACLPATTDTPQCQKRVGAWAALGERYRKNPGRQMPEAGRVGWGLGIEKGTL